MRAALTTALILWASIASAQDTETPAPLSEPPMTLSRMAEIILAIDPDARSRGAAFELTIDDVPVLVVTDPRADRMRAMVPIRSAEGMTAEELNRLMQANFDAALDARYAVGVFIHPLSPLEKDQFLSGLVQTVTVAKTYGTTFSGGAAVFGGGDSNGIYEGLLEELRKKGQEL